MYSFESSVFNHSFNTVFYCLETPELFLESLYWEHLKSYLVLYFLFDITIGILLKFADRAVLEGSSL